MAETPVLKKTPLYDLHQSLGGRMVAFAGYSMPVQYQTGIIAEHLHTRSSASLFDVSHMGQASIVGPNPIAALETLVPGDLAGLDVNRMRYTQLTNNTGGILDDLMVTRLEDGLAIVVNAGRKEQDYEHLQAELGRHGCNLETHNDRGLIALQGPKAVSVLSRYNADIGTLKFLDVGNFEVLGVHCLVSRSGYTGEDGFEIALPSTAAESLAETLLSQAEVEPAGLGARDSLRLEAGLCLYGHDIDETTTPVEAGLSWSIGKRRRDEGGFPGADVIGAQKKNGPARKRVGLKLTGKAPAREGCRITSLHGKDIGSVTSGGYAPSLQQPIAMGYVARDYASAGIELNIVVRDKPLKAVVTALPFVKPGYVRT
jgi:aminomethyltransferase